MRNDDEAAAAPEAQKQKEEMAAIERLDACIAGSSDEGERLRWRGERGWSLVKLGRYGDAEAEFQECLRLRPEWSTGYVGLAHIARIQQKWDRARYYLEPCLKKFSNAPGRLKWRIWLGDCLTRLGQFQEAEDLYQALALDNPDVPDGWVGIARAAERRKAWAEAAAHWETCLFRFPDGPASWRVSGARALSNARLWPQAFSKWDTLAKAEGADPSVAIGRAKAYLAWKGPDREIEQEVENALALFARDLPLTKLHAEIARLRGDDRAALSRYVKCIEIDSLDIEGYSHALQIALRTSDARAAVEICGRAPPSLAKNDEFKSRALLAYYEIVRNYEAARQTIDSIDVEMVSVAGAIGMLRCLRNVHEFPRMRQLGDVFRRRFPNNEYIIGLYLFALRHADSDAVFEAEKVRLIEPMPEAEAYRALSILRPGWLSAAEAKRVIDFEFSPERAEPTNLDNLSRFGFRRDTNTLAYLADRISRHGSLGARLLVEAMLAQVADRERMVLAYLQDTPWSEFRQAGERLATRYTALLAAETKTAAPAGALLDLSLRLQDLRARGGVVRLNTAESYAEAAEFAVWLADRIRRREPTSVLRLCDGEGNFLPYPREFREFQDGDQLAIQQIWWGGARLVGGDKDRIMVRAQEAIANADALGVPPQIRLAIYVQDTLRTANQRGLASSLTYVWSLEQRLTDAKFITSSDINNDLEDWDLFRQVFSSLSEISFISCHNLQSVLAEKFGLAVRQARLIPGEYAFSGMFSRTAEATGTFYPDVFNHLAQTLVVEPGEVFLVAAGFLGKLLCHRIREMGGIAIDIGSVADLWMGHRTRNRDLTEVEFDVAGSLISGHPFRDDFKIPETAAGDDCWSDRRRRKNLWPAFNFLFDAAKTDPSRRYPLRVIGHPRCGSQYTANVLNALGLQVGHERTGRDGLCSWIHAVEDLNPPYKAPVLRGKDFEVTLCYVRNPADALASIVIENCQGASFAFRRFHIARQLGRDIAARRDPLERAIDSLVSWMEIVERQRPLLTLRVEHLLDDLAAGDEVLRGVGLSVDWTLKAQATAQSKGVNSTSYASSAVKPLLDWRRYASLPSDLKDALHQFCRRFNYPYPLGAPD